MSNLSCDRTLDMCSLDIYILLILENAIKNKNMKGNGLTD